MREESFTFYEFMDELRTLKVAPIVGEVIDREGVYDIHAINVFLKTLVAVYKVFDTWSVLLKNITYCLRVVWRR
jgi:hypothetical protein